MKNFLTLPRDVLISVMKKHQRYFPVQRVGATLQANREQSGKASSQSARSQTLAGRPYCHISSPSATATTSALTPSVEGNEHVLGARFADANFFVREDVKLKLEEYRPKLSKLTFHTKLGSYLDKSERMLILGAEIGSTCSASKIMPTLIKPIGRAVYLSKADLVTQMVTEMTSLQGIIGGEYALRSGEAKRSRKGDREQYQTVPQIQNRSRCCIDR